MTKRTLKDLKNNLGLLKKELRKEMEAIAVEMSSSSKAMAQRSVISKGLPGERYSTNEVPEFFFFNKALNKKGEAFLKRKKKAGSAGATWGDFREAQGLQSKFVDLFYSGDMWKNIGIVKVVRRRNNTETVAILGGLTEDAQNKMDWNRERYGEFILNNIGEADYAFIQQVAEDKVIAVLKRTL